MLVLGGVLMCAGVAAVVAAIISTRLNAVDFRGLLSRPPPEPLERRPSPLPAFELSTVQDRSQFQRVAALIALTVLSGITASALLSCGQKASSTDNEIATVEAIALTVQVDIEIATVLANQAAHRPVAKAEHATRTAVQTQIAQRHAAPYESEGMRARRIQREEAATATARAEATALAFRRPTVDIFALRRAGREHDFDQDCYWDVNRMTVEHSIPEDTRQAMLYGGYCDIGDADAQAPAGAYSGADRLASWRGSPTPVPTPTTSPYPWRKTPTP